MNREQKEKEIAIVKDMLSRSKHLVITDHTGINVVDLTILRRKLKEAKSEFRVSKNTLLRLAVKDTDLEEIQEHFNGPTSIVCGFDDPMVPAKILYDMMKETERPKFKSYYFEGEQHSLDTLKRMAELRSKDEVIAVLMGTIEGPLRQYVSLLDAASREFIGTLEALAESRK